MPSISSTVKKPLCSFLLQLFLYHVFEHATIHSVKNRSLYKVIATLMRLGTKQEEILWRGYQRVLGI